MLYADRLQGCFQRETCGKSKRRGDWRLHIQRLDDGRGKIAARGDPCALAAAASSGLQIRHQPERSAFARPRPLQSLAIGRTDAVERLNTIVLGSGPWTERERH